MKIVLKLRKNKFKGELAGFHADLTNIPQQLIDYLIKEAGKDTNNAINFINKITDQLEEYDNKESAGDHPGDPEALPPNKGEEQSKSSKTKDCYPDPQWQIPHKGPPQTPPRWWKGTRRERNP